MEEGERMAEAERKLRLLELELEKKQKEMDNLENELDKERKDKKENREREREREREERKQKRAEEWEKLREDAKKKEIGFDFISQRKTHLKTEVRIQEEDEIATLQTHSALFHDIFLPSLPPSPSTNPKSCICSLSSSLLLSVTPTNEIRLFSQHLSSNQRYVKIIPSNPLDFTVDVIIPNQNSDVVCFWGKEKCAVLYLPSQEIRRLHRFMCEEGDTPTTQPWEQITFPLDIIGRPYMDIMVECLKDIKWHPMSDRHLVVLTTGNILVIFNIVKDVNFPEQEINLLKSLSKENAPPFSSTISSFCFSPHSREGGEREDVWSLCTVFFGFRSGEVYSLCPVVPFGVCLPNKLFSFVEEEYELEPENPLKKNCFLFLEEIRSQEEKYLSHFTTQIPRTVAFLNLEAEGPLYEVPHGEEAGFSALSLSCGGVLPLCLLLSFDGGITYILQQQDGDFQPKWKFEPPSLVRIPFRFGVTVANLEPNLARRSYSSSPLLICDKTHPDWIFEMNSMGVFMYFFQDSDCPPTIHLLHSFPPEEEKEGRGGERGSRYGMCVRITSFGTFLMILDGFGCILVEVNPAYFVSGVGGAGGREEEEEWEEEGGLGFGEGEGCHFGTLSLQTREEIGRKDTKLVFSRCHLLSSSFADLLKPKQTEVKKVLANLEKRAQENENEQNNIQILIKKVKKNQERVEELVWEVQEREKKIGEGLGEVEEGVGEMGGTRSIRIFLDDLREMGEGVRGLGEKVEKAIKVMGEVMEMEREAMKGE